MSLVLIGVAQRGDARCAAALLAMPFLPGRQLDSSPVPTAL